MKILSLSHYIAEFYGVEHGVKSAFAKHIGATQQQVSKWISDGFFVAIDGENHTLVSSVRHIDDIVIAKNAFDYESADEYPLYMQYENQCGEQRSFISLDIRTGEIDADYEGGIGSGFHAEVWDGLVLQFYCDSLVTKHQINDFINAHLSEFQKILSIYRQNGSKGSFCAGFENSTIIDDFSRTVEESLVNGDLSDVVFNLDCIDTNDFLPVKKGETLREKVSDFADEYKRINGITTEVIESIVLERLFTDFVSNRDSLTKNEVFSLVNGIALGIIDEDIADVVSFASTLIESEQDLECVFHDIDMSSELADELASSIGFALIQSVEDYMYFEDLFCNNSKVNEQDFANAQICSFYENGFSFIERKLVN